MLWFMYFGAAVLLAYRVGRDNAASGVVLFLLAVAGWQLFMDGPASFLENDGCTRHSHIARDC